jgi:AMP-polyphosphate phosphotransferase
MSSLSIDQEIVDRPIGSESIKDLKRKLAMLSQETRVKKIPVIILVEGWGAAGKGSVVSNLISALDPRGYKVYSIASATAEERRFPWMHRFWLKVPQYGQMAFFDRSWYHEVSTARIEGRAADKQYQSRIEEILEFERQIYNDGYVLVKLFLNISQKEQRRRFERLEKKKATSWRVTRSDWQQNENYEKYSYVFHELMGKTGQPGLLWTILEAKDEEYVARTALEMLIGAMEDALKRKSASAAFQYRPARTGTAPSGSVLPIQFLGQIDLSPNMDQREYRVALKEYQQHLSLLHNKLY